MKICKRKTVVSVLVICVMLFTVIFLSGCTNEDKNIRNHIKRITEIEIPIDSKILYHYSDNTFHNGRHFNYTVFEFENEPTDWLKENNFSEERDSEYENYFLNWDFGLLKIRLDEEIPDKYIPHFENRYLWYEIKRVYFVYFPEKFTLMVYIKPS